ncbi:hypothetical protein AB2J22_00975 [Aeromonas sp. A5]|uniref:hypothetical protein n=1 Tax=Aeromonas TaxID=642 RepID=UPI0037706B82
MSDFSSIEFPQYLKRRDFMCNKNVRLRKAILGLTAMHDSAQEVTAQDVKAKWVFLADSGSTPLHIANEANSKNIDDERFKYLMSLLNSYL